MLGPKLSLFAVAVMPDLVAPLAPALAIKSGINWDLPDFSSASMADIWNDSLTTCEIVLDLPPRNPRWAGPLPAPSLRLSPSPPLREHRFQGTQLRTYSHLSSSLSLITIQDSNLPPLLPQPA